MRLKSKFSQFNSGIKAKMIIVNICCKHNNNGKMFSILLHLYNSKAFLFYFLFSACHNNNTKLQIYLVKKMKNDKLLNVATSPDFSPISLKLTEL